MTRILLLSAMLSACASSRTRGARPPTGSLPVAVVSSSTDAAAPPDRPAPCDATHTERVCFSAGLSGFGRTAPEAHFEERPLHAARLRAFEIDRAEVTATRWAECVAAQRCPAPACAADAPSDPVRCVSWREAGGYCAFRGGRLPTEAEWERVAAGALPEHRVFPWGETPDPALAVADLSPEGVSALGAGVAEWVSDPGGFYPALPQAPRDAGGDVSLDASDASLDALSDDAGDVPERTEAGLIVLDDPRGEAHSVWRVVRGGDAHTPIEGRTSTLRRFRQPADRPAWVGLRCAYDR